MNSNEIKQNIKDLIILYFEGRTTSEQEKFIYDYFSSHKKEDLPKDMSEYYFIFSLLPYIAMEPPSVLVDKLEKAVKRQKNLSVSKKEKWLTILSTAAAVFFGLLLIYPFCKPELHDIENAPPLMSINIKMPEERTSIKTCIINEKSQCLNIPKRMSLNKKYTNNISKNLEKQEKKVEDNCNYPYYEITDLEEASKFLENTHLQFATIFSKSIEVREKIRDIGNHISKTKINN